MFYIHADMIAIPDFALGAMENWGLITYRETAMLFSPETSSERNLQRVNQVITHELAHQVCHLLSFDFTIVFWSFLYPATKVWRGIMLYPSVSVRPSVRPCSPFPIDNLSIYSRNFFKFCIHIVIGDECYGIVNGQNPSIFNGVTALFRIGKMVSGLLFLYYS